MTTKESSFNVGDAVVVRDEFTDPDSGLSLGGWQGRVTAITEDEEGHVWITVLWDSITLRSMPRSYAEQSEEKGLDWATYVLGPEDVTLGQERDTEAEATEAADEILRAVGWCGLGEEGRPVQKVLAGIDPRDSWGCIEAWNDHMATKLSFPFGARVEETQGRGPLGLGDRVSVLCISGLDESYGVIVGLRRGKEMFDHPLGFLAVVDAASPAAKLVSDYRVWFANR